MKFDPKYRAYYAADNYPGPLDYEGNTNRLFHNNCDGTFTDVSEKSGIGAFTGRTMGVTAGDFDGDGYPDIYVANDKTENFLFHNKNDGTFEEIAVDAGVAYGQNGESTSAMGPVFADIDDDGQLDLWVTDSKYNRLMRNMGNKQFEDIGAASGISPLTAQYVSWGTGIYDFDNDGWLDILAFHGGLIHLVPQEHSVFRGLGNAKFADVSRQAGPVFDVKTVARGACFGDYDNDGKIDAFLVNLGAPGELFHNVSTSAGHWITIQLKGTKSNRDGIGARLEVAAGGKKADRRARRRLGLSVAGRRAPAFRTGCRDQGRQADGARGPADASRCSRTSQSIAFSPSRSRSEPALHSRSLQVPGSRSRHGCCRRVWTPRLRAGRESHARFRRGPLPLARGDGSLARRTRLYVVCEGSDEVRVVDTVQNAAVKIVAVGHMPRGISLSPDGQQLFVANSWDDTVSVIDTASLKVVRTLPTGFEPNSVVADRAGKTLYVANRLSNDISVIDLQSGQEIKRLLAGRGASYLALSPDGKLLYCTHVYPKLGAHRTPPESEVTVIDTERQVVVERKSLHNVAGVFHIALSADGKLGVAPQLRPKNLVPLAHVEHGWAFGDSLAIFGDDVGGVVQVPLDELERYFAMPFAVAIAPDKTKLYVSSSGADIDHRDRHPEDAQLTCDAPERARSPTIFPPRRITWSPEFRWAAIPRAWCSRGDGKRLYVANRLDDSISVIDTASDVVVSSIDLGGKQDMTSLRRGERLFYTARFAFQGQFSCANCHIDSTFDGLQWDLEPDGFGVDIVDNRSIEDLSGTEPFKWNGGNPNLATECGPRTEKYLLSLAELQQRRTGRPGDVRHGASLAAQPLPLAGRGTHRGAGARQGDLRAHDVQERQADSRKPTSARTATADRSTRTRSSRMWAPASRPTARRWSTCRS